MENWKINIDKLDEELRMLDYEEAKLRCSQIKKDCQVILMMLHNVMEIQEEWKDYPKRPIK